MTTPDFASAFDAITAGEPRAVGSLKWTAFPGKIPAFVAEMDFGIAPPITQALHDAVDVGAFGYLPQATAAAMSEAYAGWAASRYGWQVAADDVKPEPPRPLTNPRSPEPPRPLPEPAQPGTPSAAARTRAARNPLGC